MNPLSETLELNKTHILIVDDDARIRTLLLRYLERENFIVITAKDAQEVRELIRTYVFDLMIFDIMMPGEDGLSLANHVRQENENQPIMLLTALGETTDRIKGLEIGADDYLAKPFEPKELLLRIKSILKRRPHLEQAQNKLFFGTCTYDISKNALVRAGNTVLLTMAENRLLNVFANAPNTVFTRLDLIEKAQIEGNERTIDVQVTRLRRKIESDHKHPVYLQTVRGQGYILKPDN